MRVEVEKIRDGIVEMMTKTMAHLELEDVPAAQDFGAMYALVRVLGLIGECEAFREEFMTRMQRIWQKSGEAVEAYEKAKANLPVREHRFGCQAGCIGGL